MTKGTATTVRHNRQRKPDSTFARFFKKLGPGLVTGASDDDPSGIATYAQTGASFGFSFLWTPLFTFPLMATIQYICAKIGLVTKRGLASNLRCHYPHWIGYCAVGLLVIANTINLGADLGALGAAINLLFPKIPIAFAVIPCTVLILLVQIFGSYKSITRILKWLCMSLLAYIATAFFVHLDLSTVLKRSLIPELRWDTSHLQMLVALLGTTISPYLFFWQTTAEVEEEKNHSGARSTKHRGASRAKLANAATDVNSGMLVSNVVMYFIILTTGATLFPAGITRIGSAQEAATALRPLAGDYGFVLFALGLIGTGFLAVPILSASAAYGLAELFDWKRDIDANAKQDPQFYGVIVVATIIGMCINFSPINPMQALVWTAVINGLLAPPLMAMIMLIANRKDIMGDKVNTLAVNVIGWITTAIMTIAAVALVANWLGSG